MLKSLARINLLVSLIAMSIPALATDQFYRALKNENMSVAYALLDEVVDVGKPLDDGRTPLMLASKFGMYDMARDLIDAGVDVNARNINNGTALMYSAISGDIPTVDLLLQQGANVNMTAKFGWSALMVAAAKGHAEVIDKLIVAGADANGQDTYDWSPLMRASFAGYTAAVESLLQFQGIDINAIDDNGATALHHATTNEHMGVIFVLLENDAMVSIEDKFGMTPMDRALATNNPAVITLFDNRHAISTLTFDAAN